MNAFTHLRHAHLSNRAATYSITLLLLLAAFLIVGVPGEPSAAWAADGEWTDPVGDVTLPNADIISGSVMVSGGVVDLRLQFLADPYPYSATHTVTWCFDTDQSGTTGSACGSGSGADKALTLWGGLGALNTGNFWLQGIGGLDACSVGSYDSTSKTLRLLVPQSYLDGDGIFNYTIISAFGGSFGDNERVSTHASVVVGELSSFEGRPLCQTPPTLQVSPTDLGFVAVRGQGDPASQTLSIGDGGTGTLNWMASKDADWLELSATEGTTPAEVLVSVNTAGLDAGVYTGHITVSSDNAQRGTPQTVHVSLIIDSGIPPIPQMIDACPANLAGQFVTGWMEDEIAGSGYPSFELYKFFGERSFAATDIMKLEFAVVPFSSGNTLVALDESAGRTGYSLNFAGGLVNGVVPYIPNRWNSVEAEFYFATHHYVLTVNGTPSASLPFDFSDSTTAQALRVHSFNASHETSAWMDSISIIKYAGDVHTALFQATFDDGKVYSGWPGTIQSINPPGSIPLPASCTSGTGVPVLQVGPADLEFTAVEGDDSLDAQSIFIANGGTGQLNWTANETIDWLSLSSSTGTAPTAVQATVTISGLSAGEYSGPITIFGDGAQGSPKTVDVHLWVKPSLPIALAAASGYDNVRLDWNPTNNPYVTTYRIERSVGQSGGFTPVASVGDTTYLDGDAVLEAGISYCYRVAALRSDGSLVKESDVDCATVGRLDLWVPDTWAAPGQTVVVPVKIRNAAGLRLAASDIWLNYDGSAIDVLDVSKTPLTADYTWEYAISSTSTYSQARIAAISDPPPMLYGNGSLFWLMARVTGSEGQTSTVAFQEFIAGLGGTTLYAPGDLLHPIPLQLQNGVFHVANGYFLGDLNGDGVIQAVDAYLALQIASGEFMPVAEQRLAGDVTGDDRVDAADASMILYYAVHATWPQPPAAGAQGIGGVAAQAGDTVRFSLDDAHSSPGAIVRTNLRAETLSDWAGGEVLVTYDPRMVAGVTGINAGPLASGYTLHYYDEGDGLLRIELAGDEPVSGSGVLATISMRVASSVSCGKTSPLTLADARLNDTAGRDFATSALQRTIVRESADLYTDLCVYLPLVKKKLQ